MDDCLKRQTSTATPAEPGDLLWEVRAPRTITLIGWALIIRGLSSMFIPRDGIARLIRWLKAEKLSPLYAILVLAMGGI